MLIVHYPTRTTSSSNDPPTSSICRKEHCTNVSTSLVGSTENSWRVRWSTKRAPSTHSIVNTCLRQTTKTLSSLLLPPPFQHCLCYQVVVVIIIYYNYYCYYYLLFIVC